MFIETILILYFKMSKFSENPEIEFITELCV